MITKGFSNKFPLTRQQFSHAMAVIEGMGHAHPPIPQPHPTQKYLNLIGR